MFAAQRDKKAHYAVGNGVTRGSVWPISDVSTPACGSVGGRGDHDSDCDEDTVVDRLRSGQGPLSMSMFLFPGVPLLAAFFLFLG